MDNTNEEKMNINLDVRRAHKLISPGKALMRELLPLTVQTETISAVQEKPTYAGEVIGALRLQPPCLTLGLIINNRWC